MSIILDALRRGRARQTPRPNPNAAQTDAVLQTLGYGRFNPTTPLNRLKRTLAFLALAVVLGIVLWIAVAWLTQAYWSRRSPVATPSVSPPVAPLPHVAPSAGREVPAPPVPSPARGAEPPALSATAARSPNVPVARNGAPDAPSGSSRLIVHNSQRINVPDSAPAVPMGAPSRSAMSTAAAVNAATVTTGDDHFARAMMYQRLGDFENALVSYRQVLQRDDLNVEAHNNLGVLYRDKGLFEDAIRHFHRAIAINPGYARARNNLGVVYLTQRKLDMSATQFHAALAIDPKNVESMVNLSTIEKESGKRDEARRWLTRAIAIDPRNAEGHYNLGLLEDEAGDRAQALSHYRAFLQYGAASHPPLVGEVRKRIDTLAAK